MSIKSFFVNLIFPIIPLCIVLLLTPKSCSNWGMMWLISGALFFSCKWLTWWNALPIRSTKFRHLGYWFFWPGLNSQAFLDPQYQVKKQVSVKDWFSGLIHIILGGILCWQTLSFLDESNLIFSGWIGVFALLFMFHFGTFQLLSCYWRIRGVEAAPLMNRPFRSVSLSEFWSRRWNTAFRDLTHRFVFRPLTRKFGPRIAIFVGFVFSGFIHELAISIPAQGGYGLPTFYFLIQGLGIFIERSSVGRIWGLAKGLRGWFFTWSILLFPVYGLFHPPFLKNVIVPFLRYLQMICSF